MRFLRQVIERVVSGAVGMAVRVERVEAALLKGAVTARGVSIGDDPSAPLVRLEAIRFEVALGRALRKEIHVESVTIERPVVSLVRRADGSWNLPRQKARSSREGGGDEGGEATGKWTFDLRGLLLVDGQVDVRLEMEEGGAWRLSAGKVMGQIVRAGSELQVTLMSDALWVAGRDEPIGDVKVAAQVQGFETFSAIGRCAARANVEVGRHLRMTLTTERLDGGPIGRAAPADARLCPFGKLAVFTV